MELKLGGSRDPEIEQLRADLTELAARGIYVGTSSWKYPGWIGQLYDESRYLWRGKLSESRFNKTCLEEYAAVFKAVCVDAGYYRFPTEKGIENLASQVPEDFRFSFKVTDEITIQKFTNLPRHGSRAGAVNENFLNADLFAGAFLSPLRQIRDRVGLIIFEFSRFYPNQFERGGDFVEQLDPFLAQLPKDWQYGIEIRNSSFLHPDYFAALRKHGVAHVFNNWTRMPPVSEQIATDGAFTADHFGARFLLTPGRNYQQAVDTFQPYNETKQIDTDARSAGTDLMARQPKGRSHLFVNNRLEGNAIKTITAMIEGLKSPK
jgi:uncharacterized protein YecE (DUF72 family)